MKIKFLSIFMIIAIVFGSLPTAALAKRSSTFAQVATYGGFSAMMAGIGCYFSNSFARFATPLLAGGFLSFLAGKLYHAYSQDTSGKKSKPQERKKAATHQVGMITVGKTTIQVTQNDITKLKVDAIVNAAQPSLEGGGGIDGAIHKAATDSLKKWIIENVSKQNGVRCQIGQAVKTPSFELLAANIIHTVAPRWQQGNAMQDGLLRSCYTGCLELVKSNKIKSIAFPALGTGHCGWPIKAATDIALNTVIEWVKANQNQAPEEITFVAFSSKDYEVYLEKLQQFVPK